MYEGTKASVGYWTGQVVCDMSWSDIEKVLVNMEEKGDDMKSAVTICLSKFCLLSCYCWSCDMSCDTG